MEKQNDGVATPLYTREGLGVSLIKQDLRAMMNGVASAAMRNAGMTADYRVNFGVELPRLEEYIRTHPLAFNGLYTPFGSPVIGGLKPCEGGEYIPAMQKEQPNDVVTTPLPRREGQEVGPLGPGPLAVSLFKEPVRECRILALMIYPPEQFDGELAEVWMDDIRTVELAQLAAFYLFSRMPQASEKAFQWIADEREIRQLTGYYILANILRTSQLSERSTQELRDQAATALQSENRQLVLAAQRALDRLPQPLDEDKNENL